MQTPDQQTIDALASHYEAIIKLIGENPRREGLLKTPMRAARALYDCTAGYRITPEQAVGNAIFPHDGSKMVIVRDIEYYSLCEHHILPFFGTVSIGYIPDGRIIGLSKVARLVETFARRLQVQERLTSQICESLYRILGAKGVMVRCQGEHLCMKMRGVEKQQSSTVTTDYCGIFEEDPTLRSEFLLAIQ